MLKVNRVGRQSTYIVLDFTVEDFIHLEKRQYDADLGFLLTESEVKETVNTLRELADRLERMI